MYDDLVKALREEKKIVRVSVRNLVEFILRQGDIDNRTGGGQDKEAMVLGGRLHRKIQRRMGPEYHAEVNMKMRISCEEFDIQVEGRADGIIVKEKDVTVDEIKGVIRDLVFVKEPENLHLAQAKCYAYIYSVQNQLDEIGVQMTYCNLETEEIKRFHYRYTKQELEQWFEELIRQYEKWAKFEIDWKEKRNASIKKIEFPFVYRAGQRDVAVAVYRTILRRKKLFVQASTGVGKTISTIFPAVKAVGEGLGDKIFYLTAKTITRTVAEQAFSTLGSQGMHMKILTLTAKEKVCFCEETVCNPVECPYAKGHFDRVNDAVFDLITSCNEINREMIEKQAEKFRVCPFELSLDTAEWADAVVCDYNYVFDPAAHLKRFFSDGNTEEYIFLIDEAHNLVERGREMYSAQLYKEDIMDLKRLLNGKDSVLVKKLGEVNRQMLVLKRECEDFCRLDSVSHLVLKLMNVLSEIERFLETIENSDLRESVLELYFKIRSFVGTYDVLDDNYVIYSELEQNGKFKVKLFCVNPAVNLQTYLSYGVGTVFFSATLLPVKYYMELLSVEQDDYAIYAESSFEQDNRLVLLGRDVSTRYVSRGKAMYEKIARYIRETALYKKGNYIAFFPSYKVMEEVFECFEWNVAEIETAVQTQNMKENERENFLSLFEKKREKSFVAFCVMGGIFSEGIDLTEDKLIGAVIVGTGLPQVCVDREVIRDFFDKSDGCGFDYAYLYPGMNKVLQSAGRVIRTEKDRGVVLLLDDRFLQKKYRDAFPREWGEVKSCIADSMGIYLEEFWK